MSKSTLEVRCCCQPTKLLGYIPNVPDDARLMRYTNIRTGVIMELKIEKITNNGKSYRAIKAEGYTIRDLIGVPTFLPDPNAISSESLEELLLVEAPMIRMEHDGGLTRLPSARLNCPLGSSDQTKK